MNTCQPIPSQLFCHYLAGLGYSAKSEATSAIRALFQAQTALAPTLLSQPFGRSKTLNLSPWLMSLTSIQTQPHAVHRKTSNIFLEEKWIQRYWCTCNLVVICWHFRIDANSTDMDGIPSLWFNELCISSGEGKWTVLKKIYSYYCYIKIPTT